MKILLISPLPPPAGGIASWTKRYLETEQALTNDVSIINTAVLGDRINEFNQRKVKDELLRTSNILKSLNKELLQNKPQIVHLNTACSKFGLIRDYLCGKMVKKIGPKLIVHCRCDVPYMVKGGLAEKYFKKLVGASDCIITLNSSSQKYVFDNCKRESIIIPNFLPDRMLNEIDLNYRPQTGSKKCIYVGHITKSKGCDLILKVAQQMPNITFTMVGYISDEIKKIGKPDNVFFTGEILREKVIEYMRQSDLFIFPTLSEGFPNVVLEAMVCGLPVVATGVGAIPDMIEDKGGITVDIGDINGFIEAVNNIFNNNELLNQMSNWNRLKVKEHYAEKKVMGTIFKIYEDVLNE